MLSFFLDGAASWAGAAVIAVLLFDRTGSTAWIAAAGAARWIPALVLGPFAGVVSDRYERTRVMAVSAAASAVVMGTVAIVVALEGPLLAIVGLLAAQTIIATPYAPAVAAMLSDLVPERDLSTANALREVVANVNVIVGPAIGALALLLHAPAAAIALDAASFLVPVAVALRLGVSSRGSGGAGDSALAEAIDGLRVLVSHRTALLLVLACGLDSAIIGMGMVLFVPISEQAGTGSNGYSYLLIASSIGSVAAAGLATRLASRPRLAMIIVGSLLLQAVPFALIIAVHAPVGVFALVTCSGAGMIVVDVLAITALQRDLPRAYLGRVFAVLDTVVLLGILLATVVGSAVQSNFGLTAALTVLGVGFPVISLLMLPSLRALERRTAALAERIAPLVAIVAGLDLFDGADRPSLEGLALAATPVELADGDVLIREGEAADHLWILTQGTLAISASTASSLPDVTAPGYVGELGLLQGGRRTATVGAAGPCTLVCVNGDQFLRAVRSEAGESPLSALSVQRLRRTSTARAEVATV